MKIYQVIIEDRHSDTDAVPFSNSDVAVRCARALARKSARPELGSWSDEVDRYGVVETPVPGWLYHGQYGPEGDCVYVIERTLDEELT